MNCGIAAPLGPLFRAQYGKKHRALNVKTFIIGLDKPAGGGSCKMGTDYKSRTQKKNEDRALQRLGEQLVSLPVSQLETMDLPDELLTAIELVHNIKSRSARRRQIQYIGALMRHIDPQPIEAALERIRPGNTRK